MKRIALAILPLLLFHPKLLAYQECPSGKDIQVKIDRRPKRYIYEISYKGSAYEKCTKFKHRNEVDSIGLDYSGPRINRIYRCGNRYFAHGDDFYMMSSSSFVFGKDKKPYKGRIVCDSPTECLVVSSLGCKPKDASSGNVIRQNIKEYAIPGIDVHWKIRDTEFTEYQIFAKPEF